MNMNFLLKKYLVCFLRKNILCFWTMLKIVLVQIGLPWSSTTEIWPVLNEKIWQTKGGGLPPAPKSISSCCWQAPVGTLLCPPHQAHCPASPSAAGSLDDTGSVPVHRGTAMGLQPLAIGGCQGTLPLCCCGTPTSALGAATMPQTRAPGGCQESPAPHCHGALASASHCRGLL